MEIPDWAYYLAMFVIAMFFVGMMTGGLTTEDKGFDEYWRRAAIMGGIFAAAGFVVGLAISKWGGQVKKRLERQGSQDLRPLVSV